jgi:hypothetical protein
MAVNETDYAIVIGINGYSQLRPLKGAKKDAAAFAEWLISPEGGGLPPKNVATILSLEQLPADPFEARPIQRDIDHALRNFGVERNQKIGRRLYFYFAGHGFGPNFDDVGMVMADAAMQRLKNNNIGLRPYLDYFHSTGLFDEVVFILDCCRDIISIPTTGPTFTPESPAPLGPVEDLVVLAAAYGEKAFEPTSAAVGERRGLLTQAVLEALRQPELADEQGRFTAFTLREHVLKRVPELANEEKLRQKPKFPRLPNEDMVFSTAPLVNIRIRIVVPSGLTGELVLLHGTDRRELRRNPADQSSWDLELPRNSRYEIEHTASGLSVILDPRNAKDDPYVFKFPRPS